MKIRMLFLFAISVIALLRVGTAQVPEFPQRGERSSSHSDGDKPQPAIIHGTVNIILANRSGIVAVTDSRLSSGDHPVGVGQKLFKIDDHTICTMAGAYQLAGPTLDGVHYPAAMVISNLISQFSIREEKGADSPDRKLALLTALIELHLSLLDAMNESQGIATGKYLIQLSFATYYGGQFRILQTTVQPSSGLTPGSLRYLHTWPVDTLITGSFNYALAGWPAVAKNELDRTNYKKSDPAILRYFHQQMVLNKGDNLTQQQLLALANLLEQRTAQTYKNVVGDAVQAAQITKAGVVESIKPKRFPAPVPPLFKQVVWFEYNQIRLEDAGMQRLRDTGTYGTIHSGLEFIPKAVAVVLLAAKISGVDQRLDGFYFHQTRFERCQLTYNGSPIYLLDKSNTVVDSVLKLGPGVLKTNPNVQQLLHDFPQLKLIEADPLP